MNLLDIPKEVITTDIFKFLQLNDLLRFRRVSKYARVLANDYIQHNMKSDREIVIGVSEEWMKALPMNSFLSFEGPAVSTRFSMQFPYTEQIFQNENWRMLEFSAKYGKQITHLRLGDLNVPFGEHEMKILAKFTSIEHLQIENVHLSLDQSTTDYSFPPNFKNLKTLHLEYYYVYSKTGTENDYAGKYLMELLCFCTNLVEIKHPMLLVVQNSEQPRKRNFREVDLNVNSNICSPNFCQLYLSSLVAANPEKPLVKYFSCAGILFPREPRFITEFGELCAFCAEHEIRLVNPHPAFVQGLNVASFVRHDALTNLAQCIESMHSIKGNSIDYEYPFLKHVNCITHMDLLTPNDRNLPIRVPCWPALETLDLTIDSYRLRCGSSPQALYDVLFAGRAVPYQPKELKIKVQSVNEANQKIGTDVPLPTARSIVTSCASLTKLSIINWTGTNKSISILWTGLPLLEAVTLKSCKNLGNIAFVGVDKSNPVFLKLKRMQGHIFFSSQKMNWNC